MKEFPKLSDMKYLILCSSMIFLACLAFFTVSILSSGKINRDSVGNKPLYTVTEYEGKIGIFHASGALKRTVDVTVSELPESDRDLLTEGIEIFSEDELRAVIEDYSG